MLPILRLLADGEEHEGKHLIAAIASELGLTEEECRKPLPSGGDTYLRNRYGWARTYLKKAGLVA
ncbi:MAG TPA: restriction endonuclease, partial [bacterium]|nr:restriction endonuclease [bacterium]